MDVVLFRTCTHVIIKTQKVNPLAEWGAKILIKHNSIKAMEMCWVQGKAWLIISPKSHRDELIFIVDVWHKIIQNLTCFFEKQRISLFFLLADFHPTHPYFVNWFFVLMFKKGISKPPVFLHSFITLGSTWSFYASQSYLKLWF